MLSWLRGMLHGLFYRLFYGEQADTVAWAMRVISSAEKAIAVQNGDLMRSALRNLPHASDLPRGVGREIDRLSRALAEELLKGDHPSWGLAPVLGIDGYAERAARKILEMEGVDSRILEDIARIHGIPLDLRLRALRRIASSHPQNLESELLVDLLRHRERGALDGTSSTSGDDERCNEAIAEIVGETDLRLACLIGLYFHPSCRGMEGLRTHVRHQLLARGLQLRIRWGGNGFYPYLVDCEGSEVDLSHYVETALPQLLESRVILAERDLLDAFDASAIRFTPRW